MEYLEFVEIQTILATRHSSGVVLFVWWRCTRTHDKPTVVSIGGQCAMAIGAMQISTLPIVAIVIPSLFVNEHNLNICQTMGCQIEAAI